MLMASASVAPPVPTSPNLTAYGASLVQVNWTNGGAFSTRVYRKIGAGAWTLLTTQAVAITSYQTGESTTDGNTYGVAHYNAATGAESAVVTIVGIPPAAPVSVTTSLY